VGYACVYVCYLTHFTSVQKCQLFLWCQYFWPVEVGALLGMNMFCCDCFSLRGQCGCVGGSVLVGLFCILLQRKWKYSLICM
jgi:hypothetical protein